jgi:asparagine synthase (glutamine-hydrolysing)
MCGIAGWVCFGGDCPPAQPALASMTQTLQPRGPDGHGTWVDGAVALGHQRLAVIDPVGGAQPMTSYTAGRPVTIVYSGEVYNYTELRAELRRRGHRFRTASDTEVVLRGYVEWGAAVAERLNGMFAFAIWDGRRGDLVLIRDRLGIKPLYYYPTPSGALFGSEPKAILAHPLAHYVINLDGMREVLGYTLTVPGIACAGMQEVQPGGIVTVSESGIAAQTYWRLETTEHGDDAATTAHRVRELLEDIVHRQLVADVPLGILLSGGLDSSTLTMLAARCTDSLYTYDVELSGYADHFVPDYERADPDAPYVAVVAARVGARHRTIALDSAALADPQVRAAAVRAYDVPSGYGDRDRSMLLLFRAIRETSTVALSGEGADELFAGYSWFHDAAVQRSGDFPWVAACFPSYGIAVGALHPDLERKLDIRGYLADRYTSAAACVQRLDGEGVHEHRMRVATHLHLTQSLRVLLDRKDRLSMASGLEVRVPYCDHRLVEYVYNTPWSLKTFDGREKSLLRAAAADLLPTAVLTRVKSAYPSTRDPRYLRALREQAAALTEEPDHQVFAIVRRNWLRDASLTDVLTHCARSRNTIEWILNLATWLDAESPDLQLC